MKKPVIQALILFAIVLIFNIFILKPEVESPGSEPLVVPDVQLYYTGEGIYDSYFTHLTPEVAATIRQKLTWDFVYPLVYTLLFFILGNLLFRQARYLRVHRTLLLIILLADYTENIIHLYLLSQLPQQLPRLARIMSLFTSTKWFLGIYVIVSVLFGLIRSGYQRLRSGS